jgi:hypothetical protein
MEPMDLLADTRRYLASAIKQLEAINAGAPIAEPVTREQAINIVTELRSRRKGRPEGRPFGLRSAILRCSGDLRQRQEDRRRAQL